MSMTSNNSSPPQRPWYFVPLIITIVILLLSCLLSNTALAYAGEDVVSSPTTTGLLVNATMLDGETVRIDVTDPQTGTSSTIAVPVYEQLRDSENVEFIAIQAIDPDGRQSGVIEIRNPFFNPNLVSSQVTDANDDTDPYEQGPADTTNILRPTNNAPLTPDGTGTVVDNVTDSDGGREFFTIFSEDGNEFFLVIDRHSNSENVHFLNAVTEEDLMSLARRSGREIDSPSESVSAIPVPQPPAVEDEQPIIPEPELEQTEPRPTALQRIGNNLLVFGGIVVVVGGIAYYFKVIRPGQDSYSDEPDDYEYNEDDHGGDDDPQEGGDDH